MPKSKSRSGVKRRSQNDERKHRRLSAQDSDDDDSDTEEKIHSEFKRKSSFDSFVSVWPASARPGVLGMAFLLHLFSSIFMWVVFGGFVLRETLFSKGYHSCSKESISEALRSSHNAAQAAITGHSSGNSAGAIPADFNDVKESCTVAIVFDAFCLSGNIILCINLLRVFVLTFSAELSLKAGAPCCLPFWAWSYRVTDRSESQYSCSVILTWISFFWTFVNAILLTVAYFGSSWARGVVHEHPVASWLHPTLAWFSTTASGLSVWLIIRSRRGGYQKEAAARALENDTLLGGAEKADAVE